MPFFLSVLSDSELTFFKFIAYLLPLLWIAYLVKDLFFATHSDPRTESLVAAVSSLTATVATLSAHVDASRDARKEYEKRQERATADLWTEISAIRNMLTSLVKDVTRAESAAHEAVHLSHKTHLPQ